MENEECIFCKICQGEADAAIIHQDENLCVFHDVNPKAPIHLLIVPRVHLDSLKELEPKHGALLTSMIFAAQKVAREKDLKGYKLIFNVGKEGGQIINHLHLHLLGGLAQKESDEHEELHL